MNGCDFFNHNLPSQIESVGYGYHLNRMFPKAVFFSPYSIAKRLSAIFGVLNTCCEEVFSQEKCSTKGYVKKLQWTLLQESLRPTLKCGKK